MPQRAFQNLSDRLTEALIKGNYGMYASVMAVPLTLIDTEGKAYVLQDDAALREDFEIYAAIIKLHGVTDIYRQFQGLDPAGAGEVRLSWLTHILVRANLLVDPFTTRMLVRQGADGLRIAAIESPLRHLNWTLGRADASGRQSEANT